MRAGPKRRWIAKELMLSNCEKTPDSPFDSMEIKAANFKGNQP